jgi:hypothetical protein
MKARRARPTRHTPARPPPRPPEDLLETADASLLDIVDHVINQGVVINGEVVLGVAGVDLVYLRLNVLLAAADRILPPRPRDLGGPRLRRP